jgi:hypothetical protein
MASSLQYNDLDDDLPNKQFFQLFGSRYDPFEEWLMQAPDCRR